MNGAFSWVVRAVWAALPFTAGPALAAALDPRSGAVQTAGAVLLWGGWAVTLCALLVPHPVSLTVCRVVAPASVVAVLGAVLGGEPSPLAAGAAAASTLAGLLLVLAPATAVWAVNGPAYPNERRFPLRPPAPVLLGPVELAWAVVAGAPVAAVALLAAERWVPGVALAIVGGPAAVLLARSLHGLSRRWLVFVPAGVVIHDPITLADPVLFRRETMAGFGPAPASTGATDLTQRAAGLALEVRLTEPATIVRLRPGRSERLEAQEVSSVLVTPTRPGAVMEEAVRRRLPVLPPPPPPDPGVR